MARLSPQEDGDACQVKLLPEALELIARYEDGARDTLFPLLNTNRVRIDLDSYVNHCLLWLNMLMYKAVDRSVVRFNPIAKIGYEKKASPKMTHIGKADFIKMLSTPMPDERSLHEDASSLPRSPPCHT